MQTIEINSGQFKRKHQILTEGIALLTKLNKEQRKEARPWKLRANTATIMPQEKLDQDITVDTTGYSPPWPLPWQFSYCHP